MIAYNQSIFLPIFAKNRLLSSFYYFFLNHRFYREHQAVLAGRVAYSKYLSNIQSSSALLRRNTHRLEKGLIMQPRRNVFAEEYIEETVRTYKKAINQGTLCSEEQKWCTDVLEAYFSVVIDTKIIAKARSEFLHTRPQESDTKKYIPYTYDSLPKTDIEFEQLHTLFLKRRSVRWYQQKSIPIELLEKAINIANLAPSACNRQPYFFYISTNQKKAIEIAKCAGGTAGWAENIPAMIVVVGDLSAYPLERDRHVIYIDASLAAMQLMLALETLGLSTCPINWPDIENAELRLKRLLKLEDFQRPIMLLSVGYGLESGGIPYSQKKGFELLMKKT